LLGPFASLWGLLFRSAISISPTIKLMFYVANSESFISHKNAINKRRILCDAVEDAKDKPLLLLLLLCVGFRLLLFLLAPPCSSLLGCSVVVPVVGILLVAHLQHRVFVAQTMERMLCKDIRAGLLRSVKGQRGTMEKGLRTMRRHAPSSLQLSAFLL